MKTSSFSHVYAGFKQKLVVYALNAFGGFADRAQSDPVAVLTAQNHRHASESVT